MKLGQIFEYKTWKYQIIDFVIDTELKRNRVLYKSLDSGLYFIKDLADMETMIGDKICY